MINRPQTLFAPQTTAATMWEAFCRTEFRAPPVRLSFTEHVAVEYLVVFSDFSHVAAKSGVAVSLLPLKSIVIRWGAHSNPAAAIGTESRLGEIDRTKRVNLGYDGDKTD